MNYASEFVYEEPEEISFRAMLVADWAEIDNRNTDLQLFIFFHAAKMMATGLDELFLEFLREAHCPLVNGGL